MNGGGSIERVDEMSGSVNKVFLIGNLGADPDVHYTKDRRPIVNLRVATSDSWKDKDTGERREKTEWHRVVIFNPHLAEIAEKWLHKGSKVFLEGALQTRKWEDKDGQDRYTTEIVLQGFGGTMCMLDGKQEGGGRPSSENDNNRPESTGASASKELDEEVPF